MSTPGPDQRSPDRRARDERIAAEPPLAPPELPADMVPSPVEAHMGRIRRHPVAVDKAEQYLELVRQRKACRRCEGLVNPAQCQEGTYDSDELGPWTLWQGNLDAALMIVGQDWGDTAYFLDNEGGEKVGNPTNGALMELLRSIGVVIGPPSERKPDRGVVFLTNAVLCLKKEGGLQGPVQSGWFENCGQAFLKPSIDLVQPRAVITLGERAYRAIERAYSLPQRTFRSVVDAKAGVDLPEGRRLFPVYHCGRRIQNTHRTMAQQKQDWQRVRAWLDRKPA